MEVFTDLFVFLLLIHTVLAGQFIEKDLNNNGKIDQIQIFTDGGTILKVENDQDQDGFSNGYKRTERARPIQYEGMLTTIKHMVPWIF